MKKALAATLLALTLSMGGAARADVPPWPPEPQAEPVVYDAAYEQGQLVGRVVGALCGLACCFGVPLVGVVAAVVITQRKKKQSVG
jgi:hypothetical protein